MEHPRAPQSMVAFDDVPLAEVSEIGGFNLSPDLELEPKSACAEHGHAHHHRHDDDKASSSARNGRCMDRASASS